MRKFAIGLLIGILLGILLTNLVGCRNKVDETDVVARFNNSVFVGDSITGGFAFNEILPRESVIAEAGATAGFSLDDVSALAERKPDNVFIMLGSCDMLMPVDDPKELFRNELTKLVNKVQEESPDSVIYLQSITPVTQDALGVEPRYSAIDEYNQLLKELAAELAVTYVDIGMLARENPHLYAEDGVHFRRGFYQLWLESLSELM